MEYCITMKVHILFNMLVIFFSERSFTINLGATNYQGEENIQHRVQICLTRATHISMAFGLSALHHGHDEHLQCVAEGLLFQTFQQQSVVVIEQLQPPSPGQGEGPDAG